MNDLKQFFTDNNVDPFVQQILTSQKLSFKEISQIINDEKFPFESDYLNVILDRIYKAKVLNEKVVIVGDYDADGIMATTILYKALSDFGIDVGFYIPNRLNEGYGINNKIIDQVAQKKYSLIITVDNGVVAYEALDHAKELNIDVIVTDHHMLDNERNYNFDYLFHPNLLPNGYENLCGAGLALLIAERIIRKDKIGELYVYAMVATIADMVSVFGFNRNIIKNGLHYLNKLGNQHIENLIHYRNGEIDQKIISFQVVPKLNTFGRMADIVNVNNIVRYFLLDDKSEIEEVAKSITKVNQNRIDLTRKAFEDNTNIKKYGTLNVLIGENIHEGITGLIAGRNLSQNNEPIIVLTKVNDIYKGSGRSPVGYDLHKLLSPLSDCFESFGGHAQACGISISESKLEMVLSLLSEQSKHITYDVVDKPYLNLDVNALSIQMIEQINNLEPFGVDFIKPLFKITVNNLKEPTVLKDKYLKWTLNENVEMLCFDSSLNLEEFKTKQSLSAFVDVSLNTFRNKTTMNLVIDYNNKL